MFLATFLRLSRPSSLSELHLPDHPAVSAVSTHPAARHIPSAPTLPLAASRRHPTLPPAGSGRRSGAVRMRSGRLEIRRLRKICQHCTKRGKQICLKMVPKKLVGLDLHSLRSVLTCRGQTCSFDLFGTSNETCPLGSLPSQYGLFEALSEMELSDDLAIGLLPDGDSLTDARYPDGFSDCGGSSSSWVGKRSAHSRRLQLLAIEIERMYLHIELSEQELYQKSNSCQSHLQEIKEKIHAVQYFFS